MDKLWYIHTMEYYSTIKRTTATDKTKDESQSHNAEQIKRLTQKNIYHIFFIYSYTILFYLYEAMHVSVLSHVRPFVTPQTVVHQAPLSVGILQARIL